MIFEGTEYPLPKSMAAPTYLYTNKKGEIGVIEKLRKGGLAMASDDFDIEFKTEGEVEVFLKKHGWFFSGVE